jgi:GTPase SAR1 family protein
MHRIGALLRSSKDSPSLVKTAKDFNFNAPSTLNNVGGNQYNVAMNPSTGALARSPPLLSDAFIKAPNVSHHFIEWENELDLIAKVFQKRRRQNIPTRCVLFGSPGVGKSQLAYEWANSTYRQNQNSYILCISAMTVEEIQQGFSRLPHSIYPSDPSHLDHGTRLEAARQWLEGVEAGNWLLILDNVFPETTDFLQQNLPRKNGRGTILFTTRTESVARVLADERHEVPLLDVKAGVELFCNHFEQGTIDHSSPMINRIVMAVGCLPLAISHAAWYMKESRISLDDLHAMCQSGRKIEVSLWCINLDCNHADFAVEAHKLGTHIIRL